MSNKPTHVAMYYEGGKVGPSMKEWSQKKGLLNQSLKRLDNDQLSCQCFSFGC